MPAQNDPGTDVMSFPLSVHPHSGALHGMAAAGGVATRFVTSVSKTQPPSPASPPEPLDEPLEEPLDEPLEEPLEELPPSFPGLLPFPLELPPQPADAKHAVVLTRRSANAPRNASRLMCRFRWRPAWAC